MTANQFQKGSVANPRGRGKGTLNKTTRKAKKMLETNSEALIQKCIDLALAGDQVMLKLCMDRIYPKSTVKKLQLFERSEKVTKYSIEFKECKVLSNNDVKVSESNEDSIVDEGEHIVPL